MISNRTGGEIIDDLRKLFGTPARASKYLKDNGVPGIKYLDGGSRSASAAPTRNFVVFPGGERSIKVLKRD